MESYVKAIRLHYRKKSQNRFDVRQAYHMANAKEWGILHDYLLESAIEHYATNEQAEEYAKQHVEWLKNHMRPADGIGIASYHLGKPTRPMSETQVGHRILMPKGWGYTDEDPNEVYEVMDTADILKDSADNPLNPKVTRSLVLQSQSRPNVLRRVNAIPQTPVIHIPDETPNQQETDSH